MYWNYRIFKQKDGNFGVHEVFYRMSRENPDQISWTTKPVPDLWAEDLDDLLKMINDIQKDVLNNPVIDEEETINNDYKVVKYDKA
jgi:hypothetical protein